MRGIEARMFRCHQQIGQFCHIAARQTAARRRDFGSDRNIGIERIGKLGGVVGKDEAGRQQLEHEAELAVIF